MTMTNTFREHLQRTIFEIFDLRVMRKQDLINKNDKDKGNDDGKYIYLTPSNGNPRKVVKLLTFLTIENLKTLQS